jgi:hypothetical protein
MAKNLPDIRTVLSNSIMKIERWTVPGIKRSINVLI